LHIDESVRKTLAPFAWLTIEPFEKYENTFIIREDTWYWDFMSQNTSYASCQAAINAVASRYDVTALNMYDAIAVYERSAEYFKKLRSNCPDIIVTPRRNANYDFFEALLLHYKNSGVTIDMFSELQSLYKTGVIDTWRLIYGYVHNSLEQKIIEKYPHMKDSHIIHNLYNIHDTLRKNCDLYADFSIRHKREFWH
jgi:hypothetical protein